jgi:hypothetical protein
VKIGKTVFNIRGMVKSSCVEDSRITKYKNKIKEQTFMFDYFPVGDANQ